MFLFDIFLTFLMSWYTVFSWQMTMISNMKINKLWNPDGTKLLSFCVTISLPLLWAGPLYFPFKWQWYLTLSQNVSFSKNRQMVVFQYCSSSFSFIVISLFVFLEQKTIFSSNFITSFTNYYTISYSRGYL